ncbi:MAG: hypothetical protein ACOCZV_02465 [Nanoarchaeota archaeon]
MDEEEFLRKYEEAEEEVRKEDAGEKRPPRFTTQRMLFAGLALVFLSIFLIYAFVGPVQHQIIGQLNSDTLEGNVLSLKGMTVVFENETDGFLSTLYRTEQLDRLVETSACLKGTITDNATTYRVKDIFYPEIIEQSQRHVRFRSCPRDTIIMLHTHPRTRCMASKTDLDTLSTRQDAIDEDILMLIMCEDNTYSLYR